MREHVKMTVWNGWSQMKTAVLCNHKPSPLLSSVLVPWRRWMRRWCGRRSCPRWTPHRCPSSPHPPPRTARPCPPSGGVANCWAAARVAVVATAGPPARPPPPLPSPLRPAEGRWRAATPAGWTGSIPGRVEGERRERTSVTEIWMTNKGQSNNIEGVITFTLMNYNDKVSVMYISTTLTPSVQQHIHVIITTLSSEC